MAGDRSVRVRLMAEINEYVARMQQAGRATADFGRMAAESSQQNRKAWESVGKASAVGAGLLAVAAGTAIKANMDFEKSMSHVGAAAGANGKELELLRQVAIKAGRDTAFSATEAAAGQEELAKAGLSVADIAGGALAGALDLAAAGTISVADAAETTATALVQFRLEGGQASHVADLLSAAANKAQGGVGDMSMALKQAGLVAAAAGWSIEDTTGVLAEFASAGLLGSDAGTSLRTMLIRLQNPSQEAADLLTELGISAYDAGGNFVKPDMLAGQLRDTLGGLAPAQRDAALATIFGSDAIRAAGILYKDGADGVRTWKANVDDAGNASRTAAAKTDNLVGDLERLQGAIESALIEGGSGANSALRDLAQTLGALINGFGSLPRPLQQSAVWFAAVGAGVLGTAAAVAFLVPKIVAMVAATRVAIFNLQLWMALNGRTVPSIGAMAKSVGIATAALAAWAVAGSIAAASMNKTHFGVQALTEDLINLGPAARGGFQDLQSLKALGESQRFAADFRDLGDAVREMTDPSIWQQMDHIGTSLNTFGQGTDESLDKARKAVEAVDQALAQLVSGGHADLAASRLKALQSSMSPAEFAKLVPLLDDYEEAVKGAGNEASLASKGTNEFGQSAADVAKQVSGLDDALKRLNGTFGVRDAARAFEASLDDLSAAVKENGRGMDITGAKGRAVQTAFDDVAKSAEDSRAAMINNGVSVEVADQAYAGLIGKFRATLAAADFTKAQIDKLTGAVVAVNNTKGAPKISAPGAVPARTEVQRLDGQIAVLKGKLVTVSQIGAENSTDDVRALRSEIARLQGKIVTIRTNRVDTIIEDRRLYRAGGGKIYGPGTPTSDSVPIRASRDEWVIRASSARKYGDAFMSSVNAGTFAAGGRVSAGGSPVSPSVVGGGTVVNIAHLSLPGVQNAQQLVEQLNQFAIDKGGRLGLVGV